LSWDIVLVCQRAENNESQAQCFLIHCDSVFLSLLPAAPKPRVQPFLVDIPALTDLKLDGKPTKLETLLQLSPWYQPLQQRQQQQQQQQQQQAVAAKEPTPAAPSMAEQGSQNAPAAAAAAAKAGQAGKKKGKPPKEPKVLEFTVKAAAAVTGADPPVMPARLLDWATTVSEQLLTLLVSAAAAFCVLAGVGMAALPSGYSLAPAQVTCTLNHILCKSCVLCKPFTVPQVLQDTSCGEVWKLQLAELLMQDWLLLPQQAVHLLNMFDRQAALSAFCQPCMHAVTCHAKCDYLPVAETANRMQCVL
jgi:hypothetical protein